VAAASASQARTSAWNWAVKKTTDATWACSVGEAIRTVKIQLRNQIGDVAAVFAEVEEVMRAEAAAVASGRGPVWPMVRFEDIAAGTVPTGTVEAIRRRGCVVVQGTFPRQRAEGWDAALGSYTQLNRFAETYRAIDDRVFGGLAAGKPAVPAHRHLPGLDRALGHAARPGCAACRADPRSHGIRAAPRPAG
jgi:Protein of unknown function (DUF1479)